MLEVARSLNNLKSKTPSVSVIILNWNGKRYLERCLRSVLRQSYSNYEILFVDNGSNDDSLEYVKKEFGIEPRLKIVSLRENLGFSGGNNAGIKASRADYVLILNNDTWVQDDLIDTLVATAGSKDAIASVGCKILYPDGSVWFSQKFTHRGFVVPFFLQSLTKNRIEEISNRSAVNLSNSGCGVLYRRKALDVVGLFDEDFHSNCEDWDLGFRLNLAGFISVYVPKALIYHIGGGTEGFSPHRQVKIYRNMLLTYFKNYDEQDLLLRFPLFAFVFLPLYHLGWVVQRLATKPSQFNRRQALQYGLALARAYWAFVNSLQVFVPKRRSVRHLRKTADTEIFKNTNLGIIL